MTKLISLDEFRAAAKDGGRPDGIVQRFSTGASLNVDTGVDRTERFCFSDGSIDRAGDRIDPKGWDVSRFATGNPVALWAHQSLERPIGKARNVGLVGDKLIGDIEFATAEQYDFADSVYRLVKGGFINAVSVGFNPTEYVFVQEKNRPFGIDFKKQELLEISVCPVPCNANALIEARAKGIDTRPLIQWAEKLLDSGGSVAITKAELETLRIAAKEPAIKAGRAISSENMGRLTKAMEHIQGVMDSNAADPDANGDNATTGGDIGTDGQFPGLADPLGSKPIILSLREQAQVTLAATRADQKRDDLAA